MAITTNLFKKDYYSFIILFHIIWNIYELMLNNHTMDDVIIIALL